jgi:hypothetical protein
MAAIIVQPTAIQDLSVPAAATAVSWHLITLVPSCVDPRGHYSFAMLPTFRLAIPSILLLQERSDETQQLILLPMCSEASTLR